MIAATAFCLALGALLLFLPVSNLLWSLVAVRAEWESAQVLMYVVMAPMALCLPLLARRFSQNRPTWSNIGVFLIVGTAMVALSCAAFFGLALLINVTDSSHGGTLFVFALGVLGLLMAATGWLLWHTRRSLGAPSKAKSAA